MIDHSTHMYDAHVHTFHVNIVNLQNRYTNAKKSGFYMSIIPKYILKRMVPENALFNTCKETPGVPDAFGFYFINVLAPLTIPSDLPNTPEELARMAEVDDLSNLFNLTVDGQDIGFDINKLEMRVEDTSVTLANVTAAAGLMIPVGGKVIIMHDYPGGLSVGEHEITVKINIGGSLQEISIKRELNEDRAALPYPPEM